MDIPGIIQSRLGFCEFDSGLFHKHWQLNRQVNIIFYLGVMYIWIYLENWDLLFLTLKGYLKNKTEAFLRKTCGKTLGWVTGSLIFRHRWAWVNMDSNPWMVFILKTLRIRGPQPYLMDNQIKTRTWKINRMLKCIINNRELFGFALNCFFPLPYPRVIQHIVQLPMYRWFNH